MRNFELLLIALPAVVAFGFSVYLRNIHEGKSEERALTISLSYGILAMGFFTLIYVMKFAAHG